MQQSSMTLDLAYSELTALPYELAYRIALTAGTPIAPCGCLEHVVLCMNSRARTGHRITVDLLWIGLESNQCCYNKIET